MPWAGPPEHLYDLIDTLLVYSTVRDAEFTNSVNPLQFLIEITIWKWNGYVGADSDLEEMGIV